MKKNIVNKNSNVQPNLLDLIHEIRAGPSHGSIRAEKYSYKAFRRGSIVLSFCQASGIIIITASGRLRPARTKSSRTPSKAPTRREINHLKENVSVHKHYCICPGFKCGSFFSAHLFVGTTQL